MIYSPAMGSRIARGGQQKGMFVFRSCLGRMVEDVMMCVERLPNALEVFRTNFRVIIFRKAKVQFRADDMEHLTGVTRSLKF
jgi:hypothetical protein